MIGLAIVQFFFKTARHEFKLKEARNSQITTLIENSLQEKFLEQHQE